MRLQRHYQTLSSSMPFYWGKSNEGGWGFSQCCIYAGSEQANFIENCGTLGLASCDAMNVIYVEGMLRRILQSMSRGLLDSEACAFVILTPVIRQPREYEV
jgi:hypothetical protein